MISSTKKQGWDDPLIESLRHEWESWVKSLTHLEDFRVPRKYSQVSISNATGREVHIFSDASKDAIGSVAYLKLYSEDSVDEQLGLDSDSFHYYTDSQVVLGYITNETRRLYVYVGNRVSRIRRTSRPSQWNYATSDQNPADIATRSIDAANLYKNRWIKGPEFLMSESREFVPYPMIDPDLDKDVLPELQTCKTEVTGNSKSALVAKFNKFSDWGSLVRAIAYLKNFARRCHLPEDSGSLGSRSDPSFLEETKQYIIKTVKQDVYSAEINAIQEGKHPPADSSLLPLAPILNSDGLLCVGGRLARLKNCNVVDELHRHPIILPKHHHISVLLVRFYHQKVWHQGRHFTEGSVRSAGFWIVGSKRLISSEIAKCIVCRKLRGHLGWQHMADLPVDRLKPAPPFSYVGVDAFGPWPIVYRRTRGGAANQKRWALLFSCLVTRAIHIEVIEELSSSSFINALRRFVAIRGTNFVGAIEDLSIDAKFIEKPPVVQFLSRSNAKWIFNPPHASHMGGAWGRLIGVSRRILDSMLLQNKHKDLTHEILVTFMAEVCAIVNNRPLLPVSSDPESPCVLTPSSLLTMKTAADIGPFPLFGQKDMLKSHWKHAQVLAEEFWCRWRTEYLQTLQTRKKWTKDCRDVKSGDVVLMKDQNCSRNEWPMGIVERTFPSEDGRVRKVELTVVKDDKRVSYVRPVSQLVTILEVN
ncbi:uncharacterized protein LOC110462388 [Mizuhopecten yessoensis]|uniref:uncharacterized protein LOC110462388 n=1 Tax=Mizuhopecten yessoensis TaxID=6573 RepID=UPI000B45ACE6|nr:uncharacterized protein LOC110462388 [Mizuhopecten yessoensis]